MAKRGRPLKLKDPEIIRQIYEAIELGAPRKLAAAVVGLCEDTINAWGLKGKEQKSGPYHDFYVGLKEREGKAVTGALAAIKAHGMEKWQALAWWLERKMPEHFALKNRVELTGKDGGPIEEKKQIDLNELSVDEKREYRDYLKGLHDRIRERSRTGNN